MFYDELVRRLEVIENEKQNPSYLRDMAHGYREVLTRGYEWVQSSAFPAGIAEAHLEDAMHASANFLIRENL